LLLGLLAIAIAGWRSRRRRLHRHQRIKPGQELDDVEGSPSQQTKRKKEKKVEKEKKKEKNEKHKNRNKEKTAESPLK